jgi:transketolase
MQAVSARSEFVVCSRNNRRELANAVRVLSMDAVQKAGSGHPGMPMGMADVAEVLWNDFLRHNPANPHWSDRDRFILSNGHGSMLQYALLHLSGYELTLDQLKNFRQLHSKTPGHPEIGITPGVETSTGPLGQGLANAVGMALAEKLLAQRYNRDDHTVVDHYTYVFAGDGCLMEGISHEVCSLAGTLGLGKLIVFYDANGISIDGKVGGWFSDDTARRFEAYGCQVIPEVDGHDAGAIRHAITTARAGQNQPTLICCNTVIGYGSPNKAGSHDCHGAPLGELEIAATRQALDWPHEPFIIPDTIYTAFDARTKGKRLESEWIAGFAAYRRHYTGLANEFKRCQRGILPEDWQEYADHFIHETARNSAAMATRKASQLALNGFAPLLPELIGGSADLTGSNNTDWQGSRVIDKTADGNYLHYGVREFGMAAIMNGLALHGGFIPYGGTFLVFSDYARNALRMAALTKAHSIFVLTHDSIGLGEDGPTHQPVEQLASLRLIPHLQLWRPCDTTETVAAWCAALEYKDGPSCLVLTRQNVPAQQRDEQMIGAIRRGGYILADCSGAPEAIIIATGSEVEPALQAQRRLTQQGYRVRLVSMPCCEVFDAQDADYREAVLPAAVRKRVAVEAGHPAYWYKYIGLDGNVIGIDRFGESAPGPVLFEQFGFSADNIAGTVGTLLD